MAGTLYIAATPIGNLEDLTFRAARILGEVDVIACEDTRQTAKLLAHLSLHKPLVAIHEHNERERAAELAARLAAGESIALVSDAGTPLISDPGYRLIEAAIEAGILVVPIPGPCAAITALSASGLPTDAFYFGGFLAPKRSQRRKQLDALRLLPATLIFYEAPHRILDTLEDIRALYAERRITVARELTKLHEEFLRGTAAGILGELARRPALKGEFTLLIAKAAEAPADERPLEEAIAALEAEGMGRMEAIKHAARLRGLSKREVYGTLMKK
ncbi:MAG: Ribosomal RNA small subunit methyltransferase I [Bryobacteraceae bacterium]|nr:Ribosomal RNA small subunit methyltransferase I [Bryobacteraceae bacterium]